MGNDNPLFWRDMQKYPNCNKICNDRYNRAKMRDILKDIFSNVNDWLKFGEAKNAALLVFNGASIFGVATFIATVMTQDKNQIPQYFLYYLYSFIILNGLALVIALYSFWPLTQIEVVLSKRIEDIFSKRQDAESSILYYGHIKDYTPDSYLAKLCVSCNEEVRNCSGLESDYASQIVINSRIAFRKYIYFKAALFCTMSALLTPLITIPLGFFIKTTSCIINKQYTKCLIYLLMFILSSVIVWKFCVILWKAII